MNPDKKTQMDESSRKTEESCTKENKTEATKWTPLRKFASPVPSKRNTENDTAPGIEIKENKTKKKILYR